MPDYNDSDFDQGHDDEHIPHGAMMAHVTGGGHDDEHEGAPEWLISFADMVMLIMGFFVILFALNMAPPATAGAGGNEEGEGTDMVSFDRWAELRCRAWSCWNCPHRLTRNEIRTLRCSFVHRACLRFLARTC